MKVFHAFLGTSWDILGHLGTFWDSLGLWIHMIHMIHSKSQFTMQQVRAWKHCINSHVVTTFAHRLQSLQVY